MEAHMEVDRREVALMAVDHREARRADTNNVHCATFSYRYNDNINVRKILQVS